VLARLAARLAFHGVARLPVALADAAHRSRREAETRDLDLRQRDRDDVLALPPDQLALCEVLAEVLPDDAPHDLLEALHVALDLAQHQRHGRVVSACCRRARRSMPRS
jgi:hypothetical protein